MNEELSRWVTLQTDIRIALTAVQRQQLELLSDIAKQMEDSLQAISVVIQELLEKK